MQLRDHRLTDLVGTLAPALPSRPTPTDRASSALGFARIAIACGASLLAACGGGSTTPNTTPQPSADETYDVSAFSYEDTNDEGFRPLGARSTQLLEFAEGTIMLPRGLQSWVRQDSADGGLFELVAGSSEPFASTFQPHHSESADFAGDGTVQQLVVGTSSGGVPNVQLLRDIGFGMERYSVQLPTGLPAVDLLDARCGDVDGDGTDEIALVGGGANGWVRVLDMHFDGGIPVTSTLFAIDLGERAYPSAAILQLDDDEARELAVSIRYGGLWAAGALTAQTFDDEATGFAPRAEFVSFTTDAWAELLAVEWDGDDRDELALAYHGFASTAARFDVTVVDDTCFADVPTLDILHSLSGAGFTDAFERIHENLRPRPVRAVDMDGNGLSEIATVRYSEETFGFPIGLRAEFLRITGTVWSTTLFDFTSIDPLGRPTAIDLDGADRDGDGRDDVLLMAVRDDGSKYDVERYDLVLDTGPPSVTGSSAIGHLSTPVYDDTDRIVVGMSDLEGEGLRVRFTGNEDICLPDPIPIVLMAAPPTADAADQNLDDTAVAYTTTETSTDAHTVSIGTSLSTSVGFEAEDLFGAFGVSSKVKLSYEIERSLGTATSVSTSKGFEGSPEDDTIVFQGTLHHCYEYEVLAAEDPAAIGSSVWINVPVETKVFKWTLDYFNEHVPESARIDAATVLGHTIGDPSSYPTEAELTGLLSTYTGWEGESTTIGLGASANTIGLSLADELTVGESHTYGVESETEFKVGGATVGVTAGITSSNVYEVTFTRETDYDASIGDITGDDWSDHRYDTGLVVYTRDEAGELPYQVVRFWTGSLGPAYD